MATEVLGITELVDSQAAKYATHNEALRQLEGRMVRVKSRTTTAQPGSPAAGDTYILPTGATGTNWAGNDGKIAHYYGDTWKFWTPTEGTRVWVNDEDSVVAYTGSAWVLDTRMPMLSKSVAGGSNVTLTEAESRSPAIDLTGAITANINVIVTNTPKLLIVKNSTTGAFAITVKTSAGAGVIVSQGTRALLYCDGTDVVSIAGAAGNPQGDRKESVRVATTANITLSGTQTIDSVAVVAGDRVLVKNQTTGSENGIYVCAAGAWARAADANTSDKVTAGMFTVAAEGGTQPDTLWVLTTNDPITLGTTALTFAQLSGSGATTFLGLTDTPSSYIGQTLKFVRVNAGESALEFATPSGGGNVSGPASATDNALTRFDGTTGTAIQNSTWLLGDTGDLNAQDGVLQRPELKDYAETVTSPTISSGTLTLDLTNGNVFEVTLNANVTTLTLSNPPASGKAGSLTLILKQDATGGRTFAWPAAVKSANGADPVISSAANAIDIYTLLTTDAGTTWYVFTGGKAFA
ncbi:MAG: DUF2793 domain-containing protein [Gammaproteobacteria bacterium]